MAVPSSGELRLRGDIALEVYGNATGNNISLGAMSDEAGFTAPDAMSDFYGYVSAAAPSVTTNAATSISGGAMTLNGNVTFDGDATITERGFYFGTNSSSPINNAKYTVGGTTGAYSLSRTGLNPSTTYYFWAFATNAVGTTYGTRISQATNAAFAPTFAPISLYDSRSGVAGFIGNPQSLTYSYYNPDTSSYTQYASFSNPDVQGNNNLQWGGWNKTGNYQNRCTNAYNLRQDLSVSDENQTYFNRYIGADDIAEYYVQGSGIYLKDRSINAYSTGITPALTFAVQNNGLGVVRWSIQDYSANSILGATVVSNLYFNYN